MRAMCVHNKLHRHRRNFGALGTSNSQASLDEVPICGELFPTGNAKALPRLWPNPRGTRRALLLLDEATADVVTINLHAPRGQTGVRIMVFVPGGKLKGHTVG